MARPLHPRRGAELRPVPPQPPRPLIDPATLAELRELVAGLAEKVGDPREDARALARGLATQARKLDEIAAMQTDAIRRLAEVDLRTQAGWRMRLADAFSRTTSLVRNRFSRRTPGLIEGPDGEAVPSVTSSAWILTDAPSAGIERVVMVLLFGLGSDQQQVIAARLLDGQLPPGMAPVFVTDGTDFEPFRGQRAYFERLPLQGRNGASAHRDYELYAARRFTLLCDKWKPLRVVAFGSVAAQRLEAWRQSTHVAPAIRELLVGPEFDMSPAAPATTVEEVHAVVHDYPYTDLTNGRILYDFIREHGLRRVLELGVCHGVSACYAGAAVASLGGGRVVAVDRLDVVALEPGVLSFTAALGLGEIVIPFFERVTYNWRLREFLASDPRPTFDLVFIDGAHTWEPDALAFLLSERLLRPGGWWIFDDLGWSIGSSPTARLPGPGQLTMRDDELDACQVRDVIDLVVRPHPQVAHWHENGKWGFARKKTVEEIEAEAMLDDGLREKAAATLAHARENYPEPIEVPPGLTPPDWQRIVNRGLEQNRLARLARSQQG